ncbi:DUF4138 domain-containing protein [Mucilaginibacter sp.]|uniref:DUF4138 domain-containing protein n=1 Tax=Mucilaginibacter sp. TaxID=1882438 RepID=UPI003D0977E2
MKKLIIILILAVTVTGSFAQDTAYISRDKTTALFFRSPVKIISKKPADFSIAQKEHGLITLKAEKSGFVTSVINVQDLSTHKVYPITVAYSYGRAGRRIEIGEQSPLTVTMMKDSQTSYALISDQLAAGKRSAVVDRKKTGGVKVWINKLSLAGNRVFFRLDIRNRSKLSHEIDFVRFYIRDLKTVARMATHEQEIVPVYATLNRHTTILERQETAKIFAFHRFSLSEDQALNIELYERHGNRHLYLRVRQKDFDNLKTINPAMQQPVTLAAHISN